MSFKSQIEPYAKKHKFNYFIKNMSDQEIFEFLKEDIFNCESLDLSFEEAKAKCLTVCVSLDQLISEEDQKGLFDILQLFKDKF
jgi:hypothetical protein